MAAPSTLGDPLGPLGFSMLPMLRQLQGYAGPEHQATLRQLEAMILRPRSISTASMVGMALVGVRGALDSGVAPAQCLALLQSLVGPLLAAEESARPAVAQGPDAQQQECQHVQPPQPEQGEGQPGPQVAQAQPSALLKDQLSMLEAALGRPITLPLVCNVMIKVGLTA